MKIELAPEPTYLGKKMDLSPTAFGELRVSADIVRDPTALKARIDEDGYLFLPGLLDRSDVLAARDETLRRMSAAGYLDPAYPIAEAIPAPDLKDGFIPQLAAGNQPLQKIAFQGPMMAFYERFLGGPVLHFDFVWLRAKLPGVTDATRPHYDIVFMGRGTKQLFTSWTPLEDVPKEKGGLMILEGSHRLEDVKSTYGELDVDTYCVNREESTDLDSGDRQWKVRVNGGKFAEDALALRESYGLRWLTADYRAGDVLLFGMYTMHASSDNHSRSLRLSSDTRYQLASEPVDERWIGENPPGHGPAGKHGMIC
ncbi:MAG: phytanoyl-CoA dioxygenase family protein [Pirellulales bacterium]|nr:phytanoyl-CoA dioxygenase family protein [Pirellulales bacterium]